MKEKKKRKYRRYDEGFKREAINLLKQGRTIKELSISLGVSEGLLYRWKAQDSGETRKVSEELKELRKLSKKQKEEIDILKKALSIFSQSG